MSTIHLSRAAFERVSSDPRYFMISICEDGAHTGHEHILWSRDRSAQIGCTPFDGDSLMSRLETEGGRFFNPVAWYADERGVHQEVL